MATLCRAYETEDDARSAVDRLLAAGAGDAEIRVVAGEPARDHRGAPVGSFAGGDAHGQRVGSFADQDGMTSDAMGAFAGGPGGRRGSFGDLDRETVTTYANGIRRVHVASHRRLQHMLVEAGLDEQTAAADVEALHAGRVLVLVRLTTLSTGDAAGVLDAAPTI
jgi:hypothetical protein